MGTFGLGGGDVIIARKKYTMPEKQVLYKRTQITVNTKTFKASAFCGRKLSKLSETGGMGCSPPPRTVRLCLPRRVRYQLELDRLSEFVNLTFRAFALRELVLFHTLAIRK